MRGASVRPWKLALPAPLICFAAGSQFARNRRVAPFLAWLLLGVAAATASDRIILRNLDLIADRTVVAVDEDGAQLDAPLASGSNRLTWDEIERGRVASELQTDFNRLKSELGPPLYKLRQRLRIGDYVGLLDPAEELYPLFAGRRSQSAYLVCQSLMWGRLAAGKREQAVEPFLRCVVLLSGGQADGQRLPGARRPLVQADSPWCGDLPPLWLDPKAAAEALPEVQKLIQELPTPRPAEAYFYYASLASAAGQFDDARRVLDAAPDQGTNFSHARQLIAAQIEIQERKPDRAASELASLSGGASASAALARYWRGRQLSLRVDADSKHDGLLLLLSLPAAGIDAQGELAAAALHDAALALEGMGDLAGAASVRRELARQYAATAVGAQSLAIARKH